MPKKISKFEKWFKAQFGNINKLRDRNKIEDELRAAKVKVSVLQYELEHHDQLSAEYRAASYARTASEKKFDF